MHPFSCLKLPPFPTNRYFDILDGKGTTLSATVMTYSSLSLIKISFLLPWFCANSLLYSISRLGCYRVAATVLDLYKGKSVSGRRICTMYIFPLKAIVIEREKLCVCSSKGSYGRATKRHTSSWSNALLDQDYFIAASLFLTSFHRSRQ